MQINTFHVAKLNVLRLHFQCVIVVSSTLLNCAFFISSDWHCCCLRDFFAQYVLTDAKESTPQVVRYQQLVAVFLSPKYYMGGILFESRRCVVINLYFFCFINVRFFNWYYRCEPICFGV